MIAIIEGFTIACFNITFFGGLWIAGQLLLKIKVINRFMNYILDTDGEI